jgi:hypothetical protein
MGDGKIDPDVRDVGIYLCGRRHFQNAEASKYATWWVFMRTASHQRSVVLSGRFVTAAFGCNGWPSDVTRQLRIHLICSRWLPKAGSPPSCGIVRGTNDPSSRWEVCCEMSRRANISHGLYGIMKGEELFGWYLLDSTGWRQGPWGGGGVVNTALIFQTLWHFGKPSNIL